MLRVAMVRVRVGVRCRSNMEPISTEGERKIVLRLLRSTTASCHLVGAYPPRIEPLGRRQHRVDRLIHVGIATPLEAKRIDPGDHERPEIRTLESALLQLLHRF